MLHSVFLCSQPINCGGGGSRLLHQGPRSLSEFRKMGYIHIVFLEFPHCQCLHIDVVQGLDVLVCYIEIIVPVQNWFRLPSRHLSHRTCQSTRVSSQGRSNFKFSLLAFHWQVARRGPQSRHQCIYCLCSSNPPLFAPSLLTLIQVTLRGRRG